MAETPMTIEEEKLNGVYAERDKVVALAAFLAWEHGLPAWVGPVSDASPGWTSAVYILLPTGQVSWHVADHELPWFAFLPNISDPTGGSPIYAWDGHTNEQKYDRIMELVAGGSNTIDAEDITRGVY